MYQKRVTFRDMIKEDSACDLLGWPLIIFAHPGTKIQCAFLNLTLLFHNRVDLSPSQLLMHTSQDYHG